MPFFKSLPPDATAKDVLRMNKPVGRALIELHQTLMRGESPLTPGERELIAAYVSGLNECQYCFGVHGQTAEALGVPEGELRKLLFNLGDAQIEPRMRVLLEYVRLLTTSPHQLVQADADAVFAAGWSERALHDAILTASLFNLMNRLLDGHGAKGNEEIFATRGFALAKDGYTPLLKLLE
jgi:uncharacterized peroxidase-related enzyme